MLQHKCFWWANSLPSALLPSTTLCSCISFSTTLWLLPFLLCLPSLLRLSLLQPLLATLLLLSVLGHLNLRLKLAALDRGRALGLPALMLLALVKASGQLRLQSCTTPGACILCFMSAHRCHSLVLRLDPACINALASLVLVNGLPAFCPDLLRGALCPGIISRDLHVLPLPFVPVVLPPLLCHACSIFRTHVQYRRGKLCSSFIHLERLVLWFVGVPRVADVQRSIPVLALIQHPVSVRSCLHSRLPCSS
mmetsp:Transcript_14899/g.40155  ORF Transcript_14899/g.40155 Transcript_14899/m.40155 type:complete len:251 (+) Transcript_14899:200-952(+)